MFFFLASIILFSCSKSVDQNAHFSTVIGILENGKAQLKMDAEQVRSSWSKALNNNFNFNKLEIVHKDSKYFLKGTDTQKNAVGRVDLILDNGKLYEIKVDNGGKSIICSGCSGAGCQPEVTKEGGHCTSCDDGECTKTSTLKVDEAILK